MTKTTAGPIFGVISDRGAPERAKRRPRPVFGAPADDSPNHYVGAPTDARDEDQVLREGFARRYALVKTGSIVLMTLFILGMIIPLSYNIGPFRLPLYRMMVLVLVVPALIALFTGRLGGVKAFDVSILLFGVWCFFAPFVATTTVQMPISAMVERAGSLIIDIVGSYLMARYMIRDKASFHALVKVVFLCLVCLTPFAMMESITGDSPLLRILSRIGSVPGQIVQDKRLGLERAQVTFEHSILYGVFASSLIGLSVYALRPKIGFVKRFIVFGFVCFASILSVSTGAIVAIVVQFVFIMWKWFTENIIILSNPWRLFFILFSLFYVALDIVATRTPFHIIVNMLTFSSGSAYNRILIFEFGIAEVWRYPIFGIGYDDWERPGWMGASMDNLWLLFAVIYGLPGFFLFSIPFFLIMTRVARLRFLDDEVAAFRNGLLITLGGMVIAGGTVHYWNAILCYFLFLLGSCAWFFEQPHKVR